METGLTVARERELMKPIYPKMLSWQARKAGIPDDIAEAFWSHWPAALLLSGGGAWLACRQYNGCTG